MADNCYNCGNFRMEFKNGKCAKKKKIKMGTQRDGIDPMVGCKRHEPIKEKLKSRNHFGGWTH